MDNTSWFRKLRFDALESRGDMHMAHKVMSLDLILEGSEAPFVKAMRGVSAFYHNRRAIVAYQKALRITTDTEAKSRLEGKMSETKALIHDHC